MLVRDTLYVKSVSSSVSTVNWAELPNKTQLNHTTRWMLQIQVQTMEYYCGQCNSKRWNTIVINAIPNDGILLWSMQFQAMEYYCGAGEYC
jgi:hypothetical protein